jgi:hypothetical protein
MNYIDIKDIKEHIIKNEMKMPSKKIIEFISKIFDRNKNIPDILNENFSNLFINKDNFTHNYITYVS